MTDNTDQPTCDVCRRLQAASVALQDDINHDTARAERLRRENGDWKGSPENPGMYENRANQRRRQLTANESRLNSHREAAHG